MTQGLCHAEKEATFVASALCLAEKQNHTLFQGLVKHLHHQNQNTDPESGDFLMLGFPDHDPYRFQFAQMGMALKIMGTDKAVQQFVNHEKVKEILNNWMCKIPLVKPAQVGNMVFIRERNLSEQTTINDLRKQVKKDERYIEKAGGEKHIKTELLSKMKARKKVKDAVEDILSGTDKKTLEEKHRKTHLARAWNIVNNRPKHGALNQKKHLVEVGCHKQDNTTGSSGRVSTYGLFSKPAIENGNAIGFAPWNMMAHTQQNVESFETFEEDQEQEAW